MPKKSTRPTWISHPKPITSSRSGEELPGSLAARDDRPDEVANGLGLVGLRRMSWRESLASVEAPDGVRPRRRSTDGRSSRSVPTSR